MAIWPMDKNQMEWPRETKNYHGQGPLLGCANARLR